MDTAELIREKEQAEQLRNELNDAYTAVCVLIGVVAQLPGVENIDIKKAVANGVSAMPQRIGHDATRMQTVSERVAAFLVNK